VSLLSVPVIHDRGDPAAGPGMSGYDPKAEIKNQGIGICRDGLLRLMVAPA